MGTVQRSILGFAIALLFLGMVCIDCRAQVFKVGVCSVLNTQAPGEAVEDSLIAALSTCDDVVLLERSKLQTLWNERELSAAGMSNSGLALLAGRSLDADVLALVEDVSMRSRNGLMPGTMPARTDTQCRLLFLETRTGAVLGSLRFAADDLVEKPALAVEALRSALARRQISPSRRAYASIISVRDLGLKADRNADTILAMSRTLEDCLLRSPCVWLLDRENLASLRDEEHFFQGEEREFPEADITLEAGLRIREQHWITATIQAIRPDNGGVAQRITDEFDMNDTETTSEALGKAIAAVTKELLPRLSAAAPPAPPSATLHAGDESTESFLLHNQTCQLLSHGDFAQALRAARAAYELEPNVRNCMVLALAELHNPCLAYYVEVNDNGFLTTERKLEILDALIQARTVEYKLYRNYGPPYEILEKLPELLHIPSSKIWSPLLRPSVPGFWHGTKELAPGPREKKVRSKVDELLELEERRLEVKLGCYVAEPGREEAISSWYLTLAWHAIARTLYFGAEGKDWQAQMHRVFTLYDQPPPGFASRRSLQIVTMLLSMYIVPERVGDAAFRDFVAWLKQRQDPMLVLLAYRLELERLREDPGPAREALEFFLRSMPPEHPDRHVNHDGTAIIPCVVRFLHYIKNPGEKSQYCCRILRPMLASSQDALRVEGWMLALSGWVSKVEPDQDGEEVAPLLESVLELVKASDGAEFSQPLVVNGIHIREAQRKASIQRIESTLRMLKGAQTDESPQSQATTRLSPMQVDWKPHDDGSNTRYSLIGLTVDGDSLVSVWLTSRGDLQVRSTNPAGGRTTDISVLRRRGLHHGMELFLGLPIRFFTAEKGRAILGMVNGDLYVFNQDDSYRIDEHNGLPANGITAGVLAGGKLFIGLARVSETTTSPSGGGLYVFDPTTRVFKECMSSLAMSHRNALDGGDAYTIQCITPSGDGGSLWLGVSGDAERAGVWQYDIAKSRCVKLWSARNEVLQHMALEGSTLGLDLGSRGFLKLDTATGAVTRCFDGSQKLSGPTIKSMALLAGDVVMVRARVAASRLLFSLENWSAEDGQFGHYGKPNPCPLHVVHGSEDCVYVVSGPGDLWRLSRDEVPADDKSTGTTATQSKRPTDTDRDGAIAGGASSPTVGSFPQEGRDWSVPEIGLEFVWVPLMRCWVGKYEVTNRQFSYFQPDHTKWLTGDARKNFGGDEQPAVAMSYEEVTAFAKWLTQREREGGRLGKRLEYRLPDGEEWTTIAQCGQARTYPWGDNWPPAYGNYKKIVVQADGEQRIYDDGFAFTCPVVQSGVNEWGLFGVGGNAPEWTSEQAPTEGCFITRGGSWSLHNRWMARCRDRTLWCRSNKHWSKVGFRLLLAP